MANDDADVDLQLAEEVKPTECGSKSNHTTATTTTSPEPPSPATTSSTTDMENSPSLVASSSDKSSANADRQDSSNSPASNEGCCRLESSADMETNDPPESSQEKPTADSETDEKSASRSDTLASVAPEESEEKIAFKVIFNRKKYDVELPASSTIQQLKQHLAPMIDVIPSMQKVMVKGLAGNDKTLAELGVTKTTKVLVVGSKFDEVITIKVDKLSATASSSSSSTSSAPSSSSSLSTQKIHQKALEKGPPDDVHPGIKDRHEPLPPHPIAGMLNKLGGKVRLTFKLELDQVWLGTKQRTEKINMASIRNVVSEPIVGREEYHIMGLQLGPTEASRYWLYWVPAQYVSAIKAAIMGGTSY
ncbi:ubiquitin domain-containing protein UBFD1 [Hyalella azteca]|uniref:Ubiquitin domain-containing protein UBFD1 n=1 Tax=Hyalella azteca TaxID=294128 RepID=A0A8B7NNI1_HYAAZ|nr:ubiquitin domain-containing protein UBFD1 [Hyalella azteca]